MVPIAASTKISKIQRSPLVSSPPLKRKSSYSTHLDTFVVYSQYTHCTRTHCIWEVYQPSEDQVMLKTLEQLGNKYLQHHRCCTEPTSLVLSALQDLQPTVPFVCLFLYLFAIFNPAKGVLFLWFSSFSVLCPGLLRWFRSRLFDSLWAVHRRNNKILRLFSGKFNLQTLQY